MVFADDCYENAGRAAGPGRREAVCGERGKSDRRQRSGGAGPDVRRLGARPDDHWAAKSSRTTTVGSSTWKVKDSRKNSATFSVSWEA